VKSISYFKNVLIYSTASPSNL